MATIDERLNRTFRPTTEENRRPVGTLQPYSTQGGLGPATGSVGSRQTATTGRTQSATMSTPRRRALSPAATNTGQSAADRVNRALAIRETTGGVQADRAAAETGVNADLAENLRRNMIEQERLSKSLQASNLGAVETRRLLALRAANQNAVTSGVAAINALRESQTSRANQLTQADTTLRDRAMAEAGAFDRALVNLDVAETQGQFGLAGQALRNQGAVEAQQAINPLEANALRIMQGIESQFADRGTPEEQAKLAYSLIDSSLRTGTMAGLGAEPELVTTTIPGPDGLPMEYQLPREDAVRIGQYNAILANPGAYGLTVDDVTRNAEALLSGRVTADQLRAQREQQNQRTNQPATPSRVLTDPPNRGGL